MTYDYKCQKCQVVEEKTHGMNETPAIKCKCGGDMKKQFTIHLGNHKTNGGGSTGTPK